MLVKNEAQAKVCITRIFINTRFSIKLCLYLKVEGRQLPHSVDCLLPACASTTALQQLLPTQGQLCRCISL